MRVLGLDLSTRCGWALFDKPTALPEFGTLRLPEAHRDDYAARTVPLLNWLQQFILDREPAVIGFESPLVPLNDIARLRAHPRGFTSTAQTIRLQISLAAIIETVTVNAGLRVFEVHNLSAKKALVGRARGVSKTDMMAAALERGWRVADDHQADAAAVVIAVYDALGMPVPLRLTA